MSDNGTGSANPAVPIWAVIHNGAIWSSGFLFANGSPVWATVTGVFGIWSLMWMVGLMSPIAQAIAAERERWHRSIEDSVQSYEQEPSAESAAVIAALVALEDMADVE